ncbi:MAG: LysM peptidoglycan-binding domain-containing protein [Verrucomicrobiales bacterium]|jgi:LysM repeat protein|nr:LysM peptidoglycan-binding domain-containing protein [Verrucomicrobiales bacterium]
MMNKLIAMGAVAVLAIGCANWNGTGDNDLPTPAGDATVYDGGAGTTEALPTGGNYTVVSGDSLWKIARQHNTTVEKLRQANNLEGDLIQPGQVLVIP